MDLSITIDDVDYILFHILLTSSNRVNGPWELRNSDFDFDMIFQLERLLDTSFFFIVREKIPFVLVDYLINIDCHQYFGSFITGHQK